MTEEIYGKFKKKVKMENAEYADNLNIALINTQVLTNRLTMMYNEKPDIRHFSVLEARNSMQHSSVPH